MKLIIELENEEKEFDLASEKDLLFKFCESEFGFEGRYWEFIKEEQHDQSILLFLKMEGIGIRLSVPAYGATGEFAYLTRVQYEYPKENE